MNRSAAVFALVPAGVATVTSTVPAPGGEVAVHWVALTHDTFVAGVAPKLTTAFAVKLAPVTVTLVPPVVGPEFGLTPVTVGAAK